MELVWRLFGYVLVLLWLQAMAGDSVFEYAARSPASFNGLGLAGLAVLMLGPSLAVLGALAVAGLWFFAALTGGSLEFIADEYIVQAGLPVVAALVTALHLGVLARRGGAGALERSGQLRSELDELHARVFRVFAVTTLVLAGLHKLNADFFAPGSCAELSERLREWWILPFELPIIPSPAGVVALELLTPALLLIYPRIGILAVIYIMAGLGHIGPAGFASTCVVMSLAFLDAGDAALLRSLVRRRWGAIAGATLVVIAISHSCYEGVSTWLKFGLLELLLIPVTCMVVGVGVARLRGARDLRKRLEPAAFRWRRRPRTTLPGLASWLALILLVNGLTPYLGVKYRFSVAMLSNLRVDQARWNSYVVPEWVRMRDTPHVTARWQPEAAGKRKAKVKRGHHVLRDGLYTGDALREAVAEVNQRGARGQLELSVGGQTTHFELPRDLLTLEAWVEQVPSSRLWQAYLGPGDAVQTCVH